MKSDRMVSLLLLLQARSPRSARELAQTLEVSMRTVYRDVDALGASGVPVYAERGSTGGIMLAEGYRQAITRFNTDELHALFLAAADPLSELGVQGHANALHKLAGALPDLQRRAAEQARQRIFLDHNKWYRSQQPARLLSELRRAVWEDRQVRVRYRDRAGVDTDRIVDPFGLVSKAGIWYLIAREQNGEMRSFRVERMLEAEELHIQFIRPHDFDLEAHWRSSTAALQRSEESVDVLIYVETEWIEMVVASAYSEVEVVAEDGAGKRLRVRFPGYRVALSQAASWGARARVLEPAELRRDVIEHARALLDTYETANV
ncbi:MAG TPA: YafY family protein [Candidatus Baltobacteraceae bacterium]|jgi:predicted DNA-binding transcriptional regulator YafY|nr:YafY family protein [Candidatus Baltobacteraceae bacterium]